MAGSLLLVGCGRMGGALLGGWLAQGAAERITVVEPGALPEVARHPKVLHCAQLAAVPERLQPDVVLLAVKPQVLGQVAPDYRRFAGPGTLFISIAVGITLAHYRAWLGEDAAVVRAMPNTPAAIGRGMTAAVAGPRVSEQQIATADGLLRAVGDVSWLDEALIDAVSAVSGSGPAYVFLVVEALAAAGVKAGLPEELAMRLARATVAGSGELLHRSIEPAAELRRAVTSPGGTTQAALSVLMAEGAIQPLFDQAIEAAILRSRELAAG